MADVRISSVETVAPHIVLTASPASFSGIPASATIYCNVEIYNADTSPLRWEPELPVNLSYRWYTIDGEVLVQDGFRTSLGDSILPGERRNFSLSLPAPSTIGDSVLRFSLVHEGHFWFYERFEPGGCDVNVSIVEVPAWPSELNKSVAARALRGSVAAEQLRKLLIASPMIDRSGALEKARDELTQATGAAAASVSVHSSTSPLPAEQGRNWKRRAVRPLNRIWSSLRSTSGGALNALLEQSETLRARHDEIQQSQLSTQTLLHQMMQAMETQSRQQAQSSFRQMEKLRDSMRAQMIKQSAAALAEHRNQSDRIHSTLFREMEQLRDSMRAQMIKQSAAALAEHRDQSDRVHSSFQTLRRDVMELSKEVAVDTEISIENVRLLQTLTVNRADTVKAIENLLALSQSIREYLPEISKEQFEARESRLSSSAEIARVLDEQRLVKEAALEAASFSKSTTFDLGSVFSKLDALLWRQVFTLPINAMVICRNSAGLLAIPEEDIDAISYYAGGDLPEPGTLSVLVKLLEVGGSFLDVGANVGLFSLVGARRVGATGRIWAIEPMHSTAAALKTSIRLNGFEHIVTIVESAAGRSSGTGQINIGRTSGHNSMLPLENSRKTASVQVVVLDDIIHDQKVDVIKIDVEGWELEVLAGLRRTIAANPDVAIIFEFAPSHLKRAEISISRWRSALREFEMKIYEINESSGMLSPLRRTGLSKIETMNLLMCRQAPPGLLS